MIALPYRHGACKQPLSRMLLPNKQTAESKACSMDVREAQVRDHDELLQIIARSQLRCGPAVSVVACRRGCDMLVRSSDCLVATGVPP